MDVGRIDPERPTLVCDTECYSDYWLIAFKHVETRQIASYPLHEGQPLDRSAIAAIFRTYKIVTFNGTNYDMPMIAAAMAGHDCATLKAMSDQIILGQMKPWIFEEKYGVVIPRDVDHIDLIEPAFGTASLKLYGGRLHSRRLQDLPIDPDDSIASEQRETLRLYCINDLDTTIDLYEALKPDLELRERMSIQYGIDLRSKSDAQMAEAIIRDKVQRRMGTKIYRPELPAGTQFQYRPPAFVSFATPECQAAFETVRAATFNLKPNGRPYVPEWGKGADDGTGLAVHAPRVTMGSAVYRMGYGGLHSSETRVTYYADDAVELHDDDVASYYPEISRKLGLAPRNMGEHYVAVYNDLVETRLAAKSAGRKNEAQTLKILVNGGFGKHGSKWSVLYAPDLMIQITLTGQLALLMLIEAFERYEIPVISANTDGVLTRCPKDKLELKARILQRWAEITQFTTETTRYKAVFSRDVNNYLALKLSGGFKGKGAFNDGTTIEAKLAKNPTNVICIDAVRAFLEHGVPLSHTVSTCRDIRKFLTVRKVKGGGKYGEEHLGRVVRWYYSLCSSQPITYISNDNKVARTSGCKPLMVLPDELPNDIDFHWYMMEAMTILRQIGYE